MKKKDKKRSMPVRMISALIKIAAVAAVIVIGLNFYVIKSTQPQINAAYDTPEDTATREEVEDLSSISPECILVLGASVTSDGVPSPILQDRLDTAIDLYNKGVAPKLLLSGDNGRCRTMRWRRESTRTTFISTTRDFRRMNRSTERNISSRSTA